MCNAKRVYAMDYKVNWDSGGVFAVPDAAAEALRLASGKALKVLIYMLKYRRLPDDPDEIGVTGKTQRKNLINHFFPVLMTVGIPARRKYQHKKSIIMS